MYCMSVGLRLTGRSVSASRSAEWRDVVDHDHLVCWARAEPETPARDESVFYFSYLHFVSFTGKESPPHRATERRTLESERAHT